MQRRPASTSGTDAAHTEYQQPLSPLALQPQGFFSYAGVPSALPSPAHTLETAVGMRHGLCLCSCLSDLILLQQPPQCPPADPPVLPPSASGSRRIPEERPATPHRTGRSWYGRPSASAAGTGAASRERRHSPADGRSGQIQRRQAGKAPPAAHRNSAAPGCFPARGSSAADGSRHRSVPADSRRPPEPGSSEGSSASAAGCPPAAPAAGADSAAGHTGGNRDRCGIYLPGPATPGSCWWPRSPGY